MKINIRLMIYLASAVGLFLSCTTGPDVQLQKDVIYEKPIVQVKSDYTLGPGDRINITYFFGTEQNKQDYVLEVGDVFKVEFYYHPDVNRTITIRPDGKFALARKGEIVAAGLTIVQLKQKLEKLYSDIFKDPLVTISLIEFNQALRGFQEAVSSDRFGNTKSVLIRPDGYVNFFHLNKEIKASSLTLPQLQEIVTDEYKKQFVSLKVTLALETTDSNIVYVSGQVKKPDLYKMIQPTTVSQILSRAGLIWENTALDSIIVVRRSGDGRPIGKIINLNSVIGEGNIGNDIFLQRFDIVFVPKNSITKAGIWIDQYFNKLIPSWVRLNFNINTDTDK